MTTNNNEKTCIDKIKDNPSVSAVTGLGYLLTAIGVALQLPALIVPAATAAVAGTLALGYVTRQEQPEEKERSTLASRWCSWPWNSGGQQSAETPSKKLLPTHNVGETVNLEGEEFERENVSYRLCET